MSLFHTLFLPCRKATELMERATVSPLPPRRRLQLMVHKWVCTACLLFAKQSAAIDGSLERRGTHGQDPADPRLVRRILDTLSSGHPAP